MTPPQIHLARTYTRAEVAARVRSGEWEQVRPGAYVDALGATGTYVRTRIMALARAAALDERHSSPHVLSHETAALVHGLPLVGRHDVAHVIQQFKPGVRDAADVRRHPMRLAEEHRTVRHGLLVTTLERTVVDCAMSLSRRDGLVISDAALHIGADLSACLAILRGMAGRRGVVAARWVLGAADDGSESPGESRVRFETLLAGFPRPTTQVPVATEIGLFWCDLGWPEARVVLEYDGVAKYESTGRASEAVLAEKRRQDALEAAGWLVIRVTAEDLRDPRALLRRIDSALRARRRPLSHPVR